jgi:hypothetical protein
LSYLCILRGVVVSADTKLCLNIDIEAIIASSEISGKNNERNLENSGPTDELYIETIDYLLGQKKRAEVASIKRGSDKLDNNRYVFAPDNGHRVALAEKFLFEGDEKYFEGNSVSPPYVIELENYAVRLKSPMITPRVVQQYCDKYHLHKLEERLWQAVTDEAIVEDVRSYVATKRSIKKSEVVLTPAIAAYYCKKTGIEQFTVSVTSALERVGVFKKEAAPNSHYVQEVTHARPA